jgi:hypothetical protein
MNRRTGLLGVVVALFISHRRDGVVLKFVETVQHDSREQHDAHETAVEEALHDDPHAIVRTGFDDDTDSPVPAIDSYILALPIQNQQLFVRESTEFTSPLVDESAKGSAGVFPCGDAHQTVHSRPKRDGGVTRIGGLFNI